MKKNLSKKQLGAVGLAAMMAVQTPAMAAEVTTSPEATVQETTQEQQEETAESQAEEVETVAQTAETSLEAESETLTQAEVLEGETEAQAEESVEIETSESAEQKEIQSEEASQAEESTETETSESEDVVNEYVLAENQEVLADGWHQDENGKYSYVKDGQLLKNCIEQIDGSYYGFDEYGIMYANTTFNLIYSKDDGFYRAKENGILYINEWYTISSSTYYYGEDGKAYTGVRTIDGKQYSFYPSGGLCKDTTWTVEGKVYYCDKEGVATELTNNTWSKIDGKYYYVKNGSLLTSCVEQIDSSYYGFDGYGVLYVNKEFSFYDYETRTTNRYKAKADGSLYVNEWYQDSTLTYYYGEAGKLCTGLQTINGKQYCFYSSGILCCNNVVKLGDGTCYYGNSEGIATEIADNSWMQCGEKWYYVKNGNLLKNCVEKINDHYYGFDENGVMYANVAFGQRNLFTGSYGHRLMALYIRMHGIQITIIPTIMEKMQKEAQDCRRSMAFSICLMRVVRLLFLEWLYWLMSIITVIQMALLMRCQTISGTRATMAIGIM